MNRTAVMVASRAVVCRVSDKIKWLNIDGIFYVHPDHVKEFKERHGPLL